MRSSRSIAAVLLAATVALAGCGRNHCDIGDLIVYWTFTDARGVTRGCTDAGVTEVRIFVDGQPPEGPGGNPSFNCDPFGTGVEGITLRSFVVGRASSLQLEGYDAAGQLLYLDQRSVTAKGCGSTRVDVALAAQQAPLQISYTINQPGNQCPTNSFVWFSLIDVTNNQIFAAADGQQSTTIFPCGTVLAFDKVPLGVQYRLDFIQIVQPTLNPVTPYVAVFQDCTPKTINHLGFDTISATLNAATSFCQ